MWGFDLVLWKNMKMEPWQRRQRFADRLSKGIGVLVVSALIFLGALQTTVLSVVPFPKTLEFEGDHEEFIQCFEAHAKLTNQDGVTSYRRDLEKPDNRIRMAQTRGFLGPSSSRVMYIDLLNKGFQVVDGYYEEAHEKSRPIRKYDWFVAWLCGTGNL